MTTVLDAMPTLRPDPARRMVAIRFPVAFAAVLAATGAFVALLFIAGFHSVLVSNQHDVDELQARLTIGRGQSQILRMEVARLESPGRILEVAQGRLGMKAPPQLFYLESVVLGDPMHPVPAPGDDPFGWTTP